MSYKHIFRKEVNLFINNFLLPLGTKSLVQFSHSITFGNNQMVSLGSNIDISNYFNEHKIPIYCSNESGRTLEEGIYTNKILEATYDECALMLPLLPKIGKIFGLNYGKNSLHIFEKERDCQHLFTFHFDLEDNKFIYWSLNNGQFIFDLLAEYKLKAHALIIDAKNIENRSQRNNFSHFNFSKLKQVYYPNTLKIFHKNLNTPIHLSPQQSKCLQLLIEGKTAKAIGNILHLSQRTVEGYLIKIRELTACSSSKELITLYHDSKKLNL